MAKVRRAGSADIEPMIEMGRALHQESPRYRTMRYDPDKLRRVAARLQGTLLAEDGVMLVAEAGGQVVGMLVGILAERWFGPDRYATDLTVYVRPEHRGGTAFVRLVAAFEAWAREQGVDEVDIGISTDIHAERTVHAYERLGYRLSPTRIVTKTLNHGN